MGTYLRGGVASVAGGRLLAALELNQSDGPWERPDNYQKANALLRFSRGDARNGFSITGTGYWADWDSTDQVPARAMADGRITRFGLVDPTDRGYSLRTDVYTFDVSSNDPRNSGTGSDALVSPKLSAAFGPWAGTEFYANAGRGFHSNLFDAKVADIDYFYASRLPGEPEEGFEDIHTHPALPRSVRIGLEISF